MTSSNVDYDQLFAYRFSLQEEEGYEQEKDIINLLRLEMINMGVPNEDIPIHLKNFYEKYNINFPLENINYLLDEINNDIQTFIQLPPMFPIQIQMDVHEEDDELPPLIPHMSFLENIFTNLLTIPILPQQNIIHQDIVCTLKEEEFNKIKKYSTIKSLNENCSICLVNMNSKEEIWELPCSHKFHSECIEILLKKYNYKCPSCRTEVGEAKHNI